MSVESHVKAAVTKVNKIGESHQAVWRKHKSDDHEYFTITVQGTLAQNLSAYLDSLERFCNTKQAETQQLRVHVRWADAEVQQLEELIERFPEPQDLPKIRANFKSPSGYTRAAGVLNKKIRELRSKRPASTTPPTSNERQPFVDSDTPRQSSESSTDSQAESTPTSEPESKKPRVESV